MRWTTRGWQPDDRRAVDRLIDPTVDDLYIAQAHPLHGPPLDGAAWSRTLVADSDDGVLAAVTACTNSVHPGRYSLALIVGSDARGNGIGTALLAAAQAMRPAPTPLAVKLRADNAAGLALLARAGGRVYQRCPVPTLDLRSVELATWAQRQVLPAGVTLAGIGELPVGAVTAAWASCYRWVHAGWSPVGPGSSLDRIAAEEAGAADGYLSVAALRDRSILATSWAYEAEEGEYEVVCETTQVDEPDGSRLVAAVLAATVLRAAAGGGRAIELDGHDGDPHLAPVVAGLPISRSDPLLLAEIPG